MFDPTLSTGPAHSTRVAEASSLGGAVHRASPAQHRPPRDGREGERRLQRTLPVPAEAGSLGYGKREPR